MWESVVAETNSEESTAGTGCTFYSQNFLYVLVCSFPTNIADHAR